MPQSPSARLGLYRTLADGSEDVDVVLDILNNLDKLDTQVGALACTSSTRPGTPYNGQFIRETDTGKMYLWNGSSWVQIVFGTAEFANTLTTAGGVVAASSVSVTRAVSTDSLLNGKVTGDTEQRLIIDAAGSLLWGPGGATVGDTKLYRSAADTLKTDDSLEVAGDLTVTGNAIFGGNVTGDNAIINGATHRPQLSTVATVANTTTETVIATLTIPAADAIVGAMYRIHIFGGAGVTGTPTLTTRARLGGVAGTQIASIVVTASSGVSAHPFKMNLDFACITTGASGTSRGVLLIQESLSVAGGTPWTVVNRMDGPALTTFDTTVSKDLVITVQWSAASASNTLTAYGVTCERIS